MSADPLSSYLAEAGRCRLLTAQEERQLAAELAERRRRFTLLLLQPCPNRPAMADRIRQTLGGNVPQECLRDYEAHEPGTTCDELIAALRRVDARGECLRKIAALLAASGTAGARLREQIAGGAASCADYLRNVQDACDGYLAVRRRFAEANLKLVVSIVSRSRASALPLSDRIQDGNLGLLEAVERFDPDRGVRFSTYAVWWIRHMVNRSAQNNGRTVRVPAHVQERYFKAIRASRTLRQRLQRKPTTHELADYMGECGDRLDAAFRAMRRQPLPLDAEEADLIADTESGLKFAAVEGRLDHAKVWSVAAENLKPIEREILRHRFASTDRTLQEIGQQHNLSRERVRQLKIAALAKLRALLPGAGPPNPA
jgi:RNA polymerase primary sigma factor